MYRGTSVIWGGTMMLATIRLNTTERPRKVSRARAYAAMLSIARVRTVSAMATMVLLAKATAMLAGVTASGNRWTGRRMISGSGLIAVMRIQSNGTIQRVARISRPPVRAIV